MNCNAGSIKTNRKGEYGRVESWYMPKGIANIFSMNEIEKLHRITYNRIGGYYVVNTNKGPVYFHKDQQGLPYIDLDASVYDVATTLVHTVSSNYEGFTKKDIKAAKAARKIQGMIGSPSEKDYGGMVSSNIIKNCPIDSTDVSNARAIFGPDLANIRGKTFRRKPQSVVEEYAAFPKELVSRHKFISIAADVFFVDGIELLLAVAIKLNFVTVEHTPVCTANSLVKHIKRVLQVYNRAGFTVRYIMMDG